MCFKAFDNNYITLGSGVIHSHVSHVHILQVHCVMCHGTLVGLHYIFCRICWICGKL